MVDETNYENPLKEIEDAERASMDTSDDFEGMATKAEEEKQLQKKYISMSRRYGYPAAFVIPPSTRYFDLPGTMDEAAIRKIMKERGKTYDEASGIHNQVAKKQARKPRVSKATKHRQKMGF